jgi:anti-sigma B factor antagonist
MPSWPSRPLRASNPPDSNEQALPSLTSNARYDMAKTVVIVALRGEFDLAERDRVRAAFDSIARSSTIVLDLTGVEYVDSTILGTLIKLRTELASEAGELVIVALPGKMVNRILEITGLKAIFKILPSMADVEREYALANASRIEVVSGEG